LHAQLVKGFSTLLKKNRTQPSARTCFDAQPLFRLQTFVRNLLPEKQSLAQIEPDGVARLGTLLTYPSNQV